MQRYLGRQSWNWDSCGLSETLFNWELRIFVNVVQLGAADFHKRCSIGSCGLSETLFNWELRIFRILFNWELRIFINVVQLGQHA